VDRAAADPLRIVFLGTPEFAVPVLRALADSPDAVVAAVSQPDKEKGRGRHVEPTPVKAFALERGIEVLQPAKLSDPPFVERLRALTPDLFVTAAFGKILRPAMLDLPLLGCFNVHGSLLPKYRGAAPIQWAVLRGETRTGITIIRMDEGMDTGPMLLARELPIGPEETAGELAVRMAALGAECILEAIRKFKDGTLTETPQRHEEATLAPMLKREDGRIDWTRDAADLVNLVRGAHPWPCAYTFSGGTLLKVHRARVVLGSALDSVAQPPSAMPGSVPSFKIERSTAEGGCATKPGTVLEAAGRIVVAAGQGAVELVELQAEGRKRLPAAAFLNGFPLRPGAMLGA
jgi:methionyl-tRNA formyltransferase